MGLPANNTVWPPKGEAARYDRQRFYSVWYGGDPDKLDALYMGGAVAGTEIIEGNAVRRALASVRRFFWGEAPSTGEKNSKIHIPLAQDIATLSSELLFSESPLIKVDGPVIEDGDKKGQPTEATIKTQERLEKILEKTNWRALAMAAAETQSPLGNVGLRVAWDKEIDPDHPFLSRVDGNALFPEYRWDAAACI